MSKDTNLIPKIDLIPHTVFLLCGPTQSGKSTFAEELCELASNNDLGSLVISSDKEREALLDTGSLVDYSYRFQPTKSRYTDSMSAVSKQAFHVFMAKLEAAISFPVSTEIVIVDSTALHEGFRKQVAEVSRDHGYRVVLITFEFKFASEYFKEGVNGEERAIIDRSVRTFRKNVLPEIKSRDFDGRLRIRSKNMFGWSIYDDNDSADTTRKDFDTWIQNAVSEKAVEKIELYLSCRTLVYSPKKVGDTPESTKDLQVLTGDDTTYAVIGDSHECVTELKKLIENIETIHTDAVIVHIGDFLDKGEDTLAMIDLMYERVRKGDKVVLGNHENYVVKKLRGELDGKSSMSREKELEYFSSLKVLEQDTEEVKGAIKKLYFIHDCSRPFVALGANSVNGNIPVFVTHAPCENKFLGKVHDFALRAQRNYRTVDKTLPVEKEFSWLHKEADRSHPTHIFGHISHIVTSDRGYRYLNKVFLDSGAVYGGRLSAAIVKAGRILSYMSVSSEKRFDAELPEDIWSRFFSAREFNIEDYDLNSQDIRLLNQCMEKDVRYISGTMCPAPSSEKDIEPLEKAFDWFKKNGVSNVVLQPKYMGSRCQMYLFKNAPDKTFATSRAGWVIRGVNGKTEEEYGQFLNKVWSDYQSLMDTTGDVIIDGELLPWSALGRGLIDKSFMPYLALIKDELETLNADKALGYLTNFKQGQKVSTKVHYVPEFEKTLNRYSQDTPVEFKGFDILWAENENYGLTSNLSAWNYVNGEPIEYVNLNSDTDLEKAKIFFNTLTVKKGMEGVVVKPAVKGDGAIPYMKVRSLDYLRLVYGYDYLFQDRYDKLIRQKNISGKLRLSQSEYSSAMKLLVTADDQKKELIVKLIGQMKEERQLDPRL